MSVEFKNLNFNYNSQIGSIIHVLKDINFKIEDGDFISLVGHTGSGKSTLVQNINALIQPLDGSVVVGDYVISSGKLKNVEKLRVRIGMAFQFAENQLFEETILKDVMFGPLNFGYSKEEALESAKNALLTVGISEDLFSRSPYELSGGQMRRVAIAGILSYNPEILILDEPTAGLDPVGQIAMMELFKKLHQQGKTIIMISHNFNHVIEYSKSVVMLNDGSVVFNGTTSEFFNQNSSDVVGLELPNILRFRNKLSEQGINITASSYQGLLESIVNNYGK